MFQVLHIPHTNIERSVQNWIPLSEYNVFCIYQNNVHDFSLLSQQTQDICFISLRLQSLQFRYVPQTGKNYWLYLSELSWRKVVLYEMKLLENWSLAKRDVISCLRFSHKEFFFASALFFPLSETLHNVVVKWSFEFSKCFYLFLLDVNL